MYASNLGMRLDAYLFSEPDNKGTAPPPPPPHTHTHTHTQTTLLGVVPVLSLPRARRVP